MGKSPDSLVAFLYILMRDEITPGVVERIMADHIDKAQGKLSVYSNIHLAAHAREVAERLMDVGGAQG